MTEVNKRFNHYKNKTTPLVYGEIEGNRPVVFSKLNNERYGKGMKTEDIPGAQPSTTSSYSKFELKYKHPLKYSAEDIVGAHHDTIMKSIITKRNTNPLDPKYTFLGDKGIEFDEDSKKFRARYDYSSLKDFYYNNSKIAIKQRKEEIEKNNKKKEEENINNNKIMPNLEQKENKKVVYTFTKFGEEKKIYPIQKLENSEYNNKIKTGEKYLQLLQQKENKSQFNNRAHTETNDNALLEKEIKNDFPDLKDMPEFNDFNNNINGKKYLKPEINYAFQHEEFILPTDPNNKSRKDLSIKALQDLQNNYENFKYNKGLKNSGTYESQMDQFVRKYPLLK